MFGAKLIDIGRLYVVIGHRLIESANRQFRVIGSSLIIIQYVISFVTECVPNRLIICILYTSNFKTFTIAGLYGCMASFLAALKAIKLLSILFMMMPPCTSRVSQWLFWLLDQLAAMYRPFRLTRAIARAQVSTRANLSARAVCRTHEKSYSAEKVLFIEYSSFNPSFMFTSAIFE